MYELSFIHFFCKLKQAKGMSTFIIIATSLLGVGLLKLSLKINLEFDFLRGSGRINFCFFKISLYL